MFLFYLIPYLKHLIVGLKKKKAPLVATTKSEGKMLLSLWKHIDPKPLEKAGREIIMIHISSKYCFKRYIIIEKQVPH